MLQRTTEEESMGEPRGRGGRVPAVIDGGDDDTGPDRSFSAWAPVRSSAILHLLQGLHDDAGTDSPRVGGTGASFGDYFVTPGLDVLLHRLAGEDDTPPAKRDAVDAMPTVTVHENLNCSVCLDDFHAGTEAKEMPCKHKFHRACISPWLVLHSSCPVCRFRIPADESRVSGWSGGDDDENESRPSSVPWSLRGWF